MMTADRFDGPDSIEATLPPPGRTLPGLIAVLISVLLHVALVVVASRIRIEPVHAARGVADWARPDTALRLRPATEWSVIEQDVLEELRGLSSLPEVAIDEASRSLAPDPETARLAPADLPDPESLTAAQTIDPPRALPDRADWRPRQDVLALESRLLESRPDAYDRPLIPAVERVAHAPDMAPPTPPEAHFPAAQAARTEESAPPGPFPILVVPEVPAALGDSPEQASVTEPTPALEDGREMFEEPPETVAPAIPIDDLLTARVTTFRRLRDFRHGYFRIDIGRADVDRLPARVPKDILFVQDSSASISELRLRFCRQALIRSLGLLHPEDRFNIVDFSDRVKFCFDGWRSPDPGSIVQATAFINAMRADGSTDLFASMSALLDIEIDPVRPTIAVLVTDGIPTTGLMDSSDIIGRFSLLNQGRISLFTFGVMTLSNYYLLDLLSYSNRGDVTIVEGGRFGMENGIVELVRTLSRPAVGNLEFYFARGEDIEVYPRQTSNLYLDRPLVLYGRYRRGTRRVVFQAVGKAGENRVDMIFNLPLEESTVPEGEADIRDNWAKQKLYHLIAKYARTQDAKLLDEIRSTARGYRQDIPHQRQLF